MSTLGPPPSVGNGTTPIQRRKADPSNTEILSSIANDESSSNDESKTRRNLHFQIGPLVISGAAIDRVRARFVSL